MKWEDEFITVDAGAFVIIQPRGDLHGRAYKVLSDLSSFRRIGRAAVVEKDLYPFVRAAIMVAYERSERRGGKVRGKVPELSYATSTNFFQPFQEFLSPPHEEG